MRPTNPGFGTPSPMFAGRREGLGPLGFGYERCPFPFSTTNVPDGSTRTAVGYQPVGMNPSTRLRSVEMSTTAATLPSEHATKSRLPSGARPSAEGVMPSGWRGVIARLMLSMTRNSLASVTPTAYTLLVLAAATKILAAHAGSPGATSEGP